MTFLRSPVVIAALAMAVLPFALLAGGLTLTSATDVVIFAVACMALNILVGLTGLVSFDFESLWLQLNPTLFFTWRVMLPGQETSDWYGRLLKVI